MRRKRTGARIPPGQIGRRPESIPTLKNLRYSRRGIAERSESCRAKCHRTGAQPQIYLPTGRSDVIANDNGTAETDAAQSGFIHTADRIDHLPRRRPFQSDEQGNHERQNSPHDKKRSDGKGGKLVKRRKDFAGGAFPKRPSRDMMMALRMSRLPGRDSL